MHKQYFFYSSKNYFENFFTHRLTVTYCENKKLANLNTSSNHSKKNFNQENTNIHINTLLKQTVEIILLNDVRIYFLLKLI